MQRWSDEWPNDTGFYWFYGKRFRSGKPELCFVEVRLAPHALMYITHGYWLHKEEGCVGKWQKAILPTLPELDDIEGGENGRS